MNAMRAISVKSYVKGTSRGPEALQSHLNDSCYANVLCSLSVEELIYGPVG